MSMSPNDPFEDPRNDPVQGDPRNDPVQGDPQNDPVQGQSLPPSRSGKGCLLGCSIVGLVGLVVCCGGGLFLTHFGVSMLASEYQRQLTGNPVIVEHIGEIESIEPNWSATISEAQNSAEQGGETSFAFEIKGSKGSGILTVQQDKSGDGTGIKSATLITPDGTRHAIEVASESSELDGLDVEMNDMFDAGDLVTEPEFGETDSEDQAGESEPVEVSND